MSRIEPVIYLDLDGVCTDYVSAAIRSLGRQPDEVMAYWQNTMPGEYRIPLVLGVERSTYWETITALGESFWSGLEAYNWFDDLYSALSNIAPVIFLTAATRAPESLSGKVKWLQARFGERFRDYIITAHKQQLAGSGAVLIDDYNYNIDRFSQAGGSGVLFPQIWNRNHTFNEKLNYTLAEVRAWYSSLRISDNDREKTG
jgi:5'(3')-deoxyribonucleotidase